jgi:hypothetical protein
MFYPERMLSNQMSPERAEALGKRYVATLVAEGLGFVTLACVTAYEGSIGNMALSLAGGVIAEVTTGVVLHNRNEQNLRDAGMKY